LTTVVRRAWQNFPLTWEPLVTRLQNSSRIRV
jgi:hypothetical protein